MKKIIIILIVSSFLGTYAAEYQLSKQEFKEILKKYNTKYRTVNCPDGIPGCAVLHKENVYYYEEIVKELCRRFDMLEVKTTTIEKIEETIKD